MKIILSSMFMLFLIIGSVAQSNSISSTAIGNNQKQFIAVNTIVKSTFNGVQTNLKGPFAYNGSEIKVSSSLLALGGYQEPGSINNLWADYKIQESFAFNGSSEYDTILGYKSNTDSFFLPSYGVFNPSVHYKT